MYAIHLGDGRDHVSAFGAAFRHNLEFNASTQVFGASSKGHYGATSVFCRTRNPLARKPATRRYSSPPAAIRIVPNANELMPQIRSVSLRNTEKPSNRTGPTPTPTAPTKPPGTRKGRVRFGSLTRSTTSATNSSARL